MSLIDEYGNIHYPTDELASGGQGVVFRSKDADLAIKKPLYDADKPDKNAKLRDIFQNIRLLPLPSRIPISLPLAILRDEPGYVMRLLSGMKPFEAFDMNGAKYNELKKELENGKMKLPEWMELIADQKARLRFFHYAETGSTRRRLFALSQCAAILARLHASGLVYGDISPNNVFVGQGDSHDIWLIDADNLCFETLSGGASVYTPHYGAPEIVQGRDHVRPRTDCWAFAVMAFQALTLCHPFIGKKVLESGGDESGWDTEPDQDGVPADLDEQAYAGYLPFIYDENNDSNAACSGCLPPELVATPRLNLLFQETFGIGRTQPHRRPSMAFWALELARAFDQSLICHDCRMSYFVNSNTKCPYCDSPRPAFALVKTASWELAIPSDAAEYALPHRLFYPFSFARNDETEYEARLDFTARTALPVRGTKAFPPDITIEFMEAVK